MPPVDVLGCHLLGYASGWQAHSPLAHLSVPDHGWSSSLERGVGTSPPPGQGVCLLHGSTAVWYNATVASPNPLGRPTKCTDEFITKMGKLLEEGCYPETAVALLGVSMDSYRRWMKQGEADRSEGVEGPFAKLCGSVEMGQARLKVGAVGVSRGLL